MSTDKQIKTTETLEYPPIVYQNIARLTEILLSHCEQHNIIIWPEYGSLLGWKRHDGVIPWDYDGDFGILNKDKLRLLESFRAKGGSADVEYFIDEDYYSDLGCMVLRFKNNTIDVIDIIFYEETQYAEGHTKAIKSMQGQHILDKYVCPYNYTYPVSWFYPLQTSLFMGHLVYIPAQPELILEKVYGTNWNEIPEEFMSFINPRFHQPPVKFIREYTNINSFQDLLRLIDPTSKEQQEYKHPIVFRKTGILDVPCDDFTKLILDEPSLYGYTSSVDWSDSTITGAEGWSLYQRGQLKINIVDSPVTNQSFLSQEMKEYYKDNLGDRANLGLTWILTNAPKVTHFHTDPEYAGGYMKLLSGKKIWWCIPSEAWTQLLNSGYTYESLRQLDLTEILALDNYALWGKIQVCILEPGDLIWFPVKCLHKVTTTQHSYGFGGYI